MMGMGRSLGMLVGSLVAAYASARSPQLPAGYPAPGMPASPGAPDPSAAPPATPAPTRIVLSEVVAPPFREAVVGVVRKPTIATRGGTPEMVCPPALYEWVLAHPDRVSLAWRRMGIACVEINDAGNGRFTWADGEGSELAWQKVGQFPDGLVWYATGKVKASTLTPTVPVRAVVVMHYPSRQTVDGKPTVRPTAQVYLQTDSKAATIVMRLLGPTAPKMAEQGAEQLVLFFSGVARYAHAHPEKAEALLGPARK